MIIGIGTDVVQIPRIEAMLAASEASLIEELLSTDEQLELPGQAASGRARACFVAKHWAAKEAFVKALGRGFDGTLPARAIGVSHDLRGRPIIVLQAEAEREMLRIVHALGKSTATILLSISDDYPTAMAMVVIEA